MRPDITIFSKLNRMSLSRKKSCSSRPKSLGEEHCDIVVVVRLYDPTSGLVLIDECDIKSLNLRSLR
ncbi:hypothetical protein MtrunA17_Chr1g0208851 [Medicago truncatula]|uniref:Uncharacterized protein n=1 Tax=Medicago truncatula TaxID=3880 RepID=A0A396JVZ3_MEDTR|nr:hypothetical protein MtrunA17_Chr1g0208851 [Medicago truncatula]